MMRGGRESWARVRVKVIGILFLVAFVCVVGRAFYLQIASGENWDKKADKQYARVVKLTPQRGAVFDRNGEPLAISIEVESVCVYPKEVQATPEQLRQLAALLEMDEKTLRARFESSKDFYWLKRQVPPTVSEKIRALKIPGIDFPREHQRFYPNSEIASQVVGFTGIDPRGLEGVELRYNAFLAGDERRLITENDHKGRSLGQAAQQIEGEGPQGDLFLTLDKNLQYIAEKELAAGVRSARAKAGTVIVVAPESGEILAMASQPDFNPNAAGSFRPENRRNRAVCDTFEPGSTFKMFLMAAALNEGVAVPGKKIDCENGTYRVGGKTIHDHRRYGALTPTQVLQVSSNIGSAKLGQGLGRERYHRYLKDFGFGDRTGIDLPGEVNGLLHDPNQWFEIDLAAISFGQGISVTPIQLAMATAAIANGGTLLKPQILLRAQDREGRLLDEGGREPIRQVIPPELSRRLAAMLTTVTDDEGTGVLANVPGYDVAGKTGTAQKVDPVTGGYSPDKRVSSFVGFVPAKEPQLVILVLLDEPQEQTYGGLVAAPIFSQIAAQSLRYLQVPPTQPQQLVALEPTIEGIIEKAARPVAKVTKKKAADAAQSPLMPDFAGMSSREVLRVMGRDGLNIRLIGSGRVVEQSPLAGHPIVYGDEVWVRLAPPT